MKNLYNVLFFVLIFIIGCSKEPDLIESPFTGNDSIDFDIISTTDTAYIYQPINFSFTIDDSVQNVSEYEILWNINDNYIEDTSNFEYAFSNSGIYIVKLTINNQEQTKTILIHQGMISYQIMNLSNINLDLDCYVDNPWDYGNANIKVIRNHISDTVFSNCLSFGGFTFLNLLAINLQVNGTNYQHMPNYNTVWISKFQNNEIELNDSSLFIKTLSTSEGPNELRLYELNK